MTLKSFVKLILSYLLNPISLLRIGRVGKRIDIRRGLVVHGPKDIRIGNDVKIDRMSRLSSYEGGKISIEDNCYIGQFFSVLAGGDVTVKRNTLIASYVAIVGENHSMNPEAGIGYGKQELIKEGVEIGENCWIGEKAIILPGVSIGDWSIIGAGSVVNKDIPSYSIAVGNPARVVKQYNFSTHAWEKCNGHGA